VRADELRAPDGVLARLAAGATMPAARAIEVTAGVLDDADRQAIAAICLQAAAELGMDY